MIHFRETNATNSALCGAIGGNSTNNPDEVTCGDCAAVPFKYAPPVTISRQLLTRIEYALSNASSFMSGFLEDDTQEDPIDDVVEAIDNLLAEIEKL